jgi:hypothetical protein
MLASGGLLTPGTARAQYSTPVGTGAAKPKTLRATAVLEWTGSLEKPNASRLMPVAVWDGERYQPAGLYLAQPAPLAFETGTQYVLERMGEPEGLFNVRGAAQLNGDWIGMGRFQAEKVAAPPRLKVSKQLPVLSNGRPEKPDTGDSDRPTLHRKGGDSSSSGGNSGSSSGTSSGTTASSGSAPASSTPASQPADTADSDRPTLHKRSSSDDSTSTQGTSSTAPSSTNSGPNAGSGSSSTGSSSTSSTSGGSSSSTSNTSSSDPDRPTLHKRSDDSGSGGPTTTASSDPDAPTLHKHSDAAAPDVDPDRPTLHRSRSSGSAGLVTTSGNIDPDRPHLRYGKPDASEASMLPAKLEGAPAAMQQMVAVSDISTEEPHSYKYQWASPDDATKMQDALATMAAQLASQALHPATSHPDAGSTRTTHTTGKSAKAPAPVLATMADADFKAFELSYSGGATVVYSAHTADEGSKRVYVTLIAQPDFYGQPQLVFKQIARGDRLDVTPAMQLVDAVDTDDDGRAELIFQLNGGSSALIAQATSPGASPSVGAPSSEREFAIYKVANGHVDQVFTTGALP